MSTVSLVIGLWLSAAFALSVDPQPAPPSDPGRQFIELYGSALVTINYLRIALLLLAIAAVGLVADDSLTGSRRGSP